MVAICFHPLSTQIIFLTLSSLEPSNQLQINYLVSISSSARHPILARLPKPSLYISSSTPPAQVPSLNQTYGSTARSRPQPPRKKARDLILSPNEHPPIGFYGPQVYTWRYLLELTLIAEEAAAEAASTAAAVAGGGGGELASDLYSGRWVPAALLLLF